MRLLIDTQIFLWMAVSPGRIPRSLREPIADPASELVLSAASLWEATLKYHAGKLPVAAPPIELAAAIFATGSQHLAISFAHAAHRLPDPPPTRDPFDQLLLAQCDVDGLRLLTADRALEGHRLAFRP